MLKLLVFYIIKGAFLLTNIIITQISRNNNNNFILIAFAQRRKKSWISEITVIAEEKRLREV